MKASSTKTILITLAALVIIDISLSFKSEKSELRTELPVTQQEIVQLIDSTPPFIRVDASHIRRSLIISECGILEHELGIRILPVESNNSPSCNTSHYSKKQFIRPKF